MQFAQKAVVTVVLWNDDRPVVKTIERPSYQPFRLAPRERLEAEIVLVFLTDRLNTANELKPKVGRLGA